jgi:hypothetical protein
MAAKSDFHKTSGLVVSWNYQLASHVDTGREKLGPAVA